MTMAVSKLYNREEVIQTPDSYHLADGSVTIQLPVPTPLLVMNVSKFGNIQVGDRDVHRITVVLFKPTIITDAYIRVDMATKIIGFHARAQVYKGGHWHFTKRQIKGLADGGCCPVCLEDDVRIMSPIQNFQCRHGVCTKCLKHRTAGIEKCPICRSVAMLDMTEGLTMIRHRFIDL